MPRDAADRVDLEKPGLAVFGDPGDTLDQLGERRRRRGPLVDSDLGGGDGLGDEGLPRAAGGGDVDAAISSGHWIAL